MTLKVPNVNNSAQPPVIHNSDEPLSFLTDKVPTGNEQANDEPLVLTDKIPQVEQTYNEVSKLDPNRAARVFNAQEKMSPDVHPSFIDKNLDNIEKAQKAPTPSFFQELESQYPGTTKFLQDPKNMAISHDDLHNLAGHEKLIRQATVANGILSSISAGFQQSVPGIVATEGKPYTVMPQNPGMVDSLAYQAGAVFGDLVPMAVGSAIGTATGVGIGGAAGTALLPGAGTLAGATVGGFAGGSAGGFAAPAIMKEALLKYYNEGKIQSFDDLLTRMSEVLNSGVKPAITGVASAGAAGTASKMFGGTIAPTVAEIAAMTTVGKGLEGELPTARDFAETAILIAGMHAASGGGNLISQKILEKRKIQENINFIRTLGGLSKESEVNKRSENAYRAHLEELAKDTPFETAYMPAKDAETYFQSKKIDTNQYMTELGVKESYDEAKQTGGDIEIPIQKLEKLIKDGHSDALEGDIKFDQNGKTANEYNRELQETEKQIKGQQVDAIHQDQLKEIEHGVLNQLLNAGLPMSEAKTNARAYTAVFDAWAAEMGVSPAELHSNFKLDINGNPVANGQTLNQSQIPNAPAFYSKLTRTIEEKMPNSASPEQINGILKEVKPEERKWSGIDEFLDGKDKVTKQELLDHLKENQIQIKEITKSEDTTKFSDYTLPGGDNYKEILLTLPTEAPTEVPNGFSIREAKGPEKNLGNLLLIDSEGKIAGAGDTKQEALNDYITVQRNSGKLEGEYKSSHFSEPNVLAHVRINDRVDSEGKKVLFLEEVQSDWHQAGRKSGYHEPGKISEREKVLARAEKARVDYEDYSDSLVDKYAPKSVRLKDFERVEKDTFAYGQKGTEYSRPFGDNLYDIRVHKSTKEYQLMYRGNVEYFKTKAPLESRLTELYRNSIRSAYDLSEKLTSEERTKLDLLRDERASAKEQDVPSAPVPDAPFKKTWHELVMKRMIRYAAEHGYDKVAWTTGEQQAARYDLSKKIDRVELMDLTPANGEGFKLEAFDRNGDSVLSKRIADIKEAEQYIGKDAAAKLEKKKYKNNEQEIPVKTIKGVDLSVGGEGMKGFYDKILVDYANKLGKKFGAQTEDAKLPPLDFEQTMANGGKQPGQQAVHSLPITDAMKQSVLKEGQPLFQEGESGTRGSVTIGADGATRTFSINLSALRDKSTFMHETGHIFLELFGDLQSHEKATQQMKDDYQTILNWLGVKDRSEIGVDQHEKWARGIEKYLASGEAPSMELRSAFQRFKDWFIKVYENLDKLNVEISPEIKEVMDRLFATKEQIEKAKESTGYNDTEAKELSPADSERLDAIQRQAREQAEYTMLKGQIKETSAEHKAFLAQEEIKFREEAKKEVESSPLFLAEKDAKESFNSKKPGDELANQFLDAIAKNDADITKKEAELIQSFEMAAEGNGFANGEDLAKQLMVARKNGLFESEVNRITKEKMSVHTEGAQYPAVLIEKALEAVHNEKSAELLATEWQVFHKLMLKDAGFKKDIQELNSNQAKIDAQIASDKAKALLASKSVKDASNFRAYITAEKRAAQRVTKALAEKDYEAAATAKREQMLNHALVRESLRNKVEAEKMMKTFKEYGSRGQDLMNAPYAFIRQIDKLLGNASLTDRRPEDVATFAAVAKEMFQKGEHPNDIANATGMVLNEQQGWVQESLPDFINRVNDDMYAISVPSSVFNLADKNYKLFTMQEMRDLHDTVKMIAGIGKGHERFLSEDRKETIKEAAKAFKSSVEERSSKKYASKSGIGTADRSALREKAEGIVNMPESFVPNQVNLLTLSTFLDGGNVSGPALDNLYRILSAPENRLIERRERMAKEVNDIFEKHYTVKEFKKYRDDGAKILIPEFGRKLTREELLCLALNWGNEINQSRIIEGYKLPKNIIEKVLFRELGKKDWDFAQAAWDHLNTYWPEISALEMKVRGVEPRKVDPSPVVTPHGEYAGGYYPLSYDFERSVEGYKNAEQRTELYKQNSATAAHTFSGHTKSRVSYVNRPVRLSLDVFYDHLDNVVHDLEYRSAVIDMNRFLRQPDVKAAIVGALDIKGYRTIENALKSVASDQSEFLVGGEPALRWFRFNSTFAALSFKLSAIPMDLTGNAINTLWEIGPKRFSQAMSDFVMNPKETKEFVDSMSPRMKRRAMLRDRDVADINRKWSGEEPGLKQYGFMFQSLADEALSYPLWAEVYKKHVNEFGERKAAQIADEAVARTMGSGSKLDQAGFQREGGEFKKITGMFMSWANMMFNRVWLSGKLAGLEYDKENYGKYVGLLAKTAFFAFGLQGLNETLWREVLRNSQNTNPEERRKRMWSRFLSQPFSYMWLFRDAAGLFIDQALGKGGGSIRLSPLEQSVESLVKTAAIPANRLLDPHKPFTKKDAETVSRGASQVLGIPQAANSLVFNLLDNLQHEGEATWRDLFTRRTKK